MTKASTPTEKSKKQRDNTKNATKNFDYTTYDCGPTKDGQWGNDSHPTVVVLKIGLRDLNLPTNHKSCVIKRTHI